jgi:hypothetical protein
MAKTATTVVNAKKNAAAPNKAVEEKTNTVAANANTSDTAKAESVARRSLNLNIEVEDDIPIPGRGHRSKYPYEDLVKIGQSFLIEDCKSGNNAAVKQTGKTKFNQILLSRPVQTTKEDGTVVNGYRFWLTGWVKGKEPANAEAAAKANAENAEAADANA